MGEWQLLEAAFAESGLPFSTDLPRDVLLPASVQPLASIAFNERSEEQKDLLGKWRSKGEWWTCLKEVAYPVGFVEDGGQGKRSSSAILSPQFAALKRHRRE
jgi:hypothetical protein